MEKFKSSRRDFLKAGIAFAAAVALRPASVFAEPTEPVINPTSPFPPRVQELSTQQKPLPEKPVFRPAPESKLKKLTPNEVIIMAAKEMQITEANVRRIIQCESSTDADQVNPANGASGWWQLMPNELNRRLFKEEGWDYDKDVFDPEKNTRVAIKLRRIQGAAAWDCK